MTKIASFLTALLLFAASQGLAQERPVLVELFTSQGCSSCPPADKFLRELAKRDDVVALSLHVDYWDYIGWKDSFASPAFTARQRAYARAGGRSMVYTPQMIINGSDHVVGNNPRDVNDLIEAHGATPGPVTLEVTRRGGTLAIKARATPGDTGLTTVLIVRYRPEATVDVLRGENAGRTLGYVNVVTGMAKVTSWDMRQPLNVEVPLEGDLPAVVIVQKNRHGPVAAVAKAG